MRNRPGKKVKSASHLTIVAALRAKPGAEARLKNALLALVPQSRRDPGCVDYYLHQCVDDASRFLFYENWTSRKLLDAHLGLAHVQAVLARADELFAEPPQLTFWRRIA